MLGLPSRQGSFWTTPAGRSLQSSPLTSRATASSTTSTNRSSAGRVRWPRSSPRRAVRGGTPSR
eukprot:8635926-Alexandrium_andersonii.AAC.1